MAAAMQVQRINDEVRRRVDAEKAKLVHEQQLQETEMLLRQEAEDGKKKREQEMRDTEEAAIVAERQAMLEAERLKALRITQMVQKRVSEEKKKLTAQVIDGTYLHVIEYFPTLISHFVPINACRWQLMMRNQNVFFKQKLRKNEHDWTK